ncbi:hypothetical protein DAPPUDRAFT_55959 [Daphnia pulex]|uniref:Uncharacterized protein n=1 Tax=Daphnia pulex TaxID=6669 RepID=E9GYL3_DAPPU|nr:hypothetical protein DAPPUDRAFT_55959 [Daphnia pulex]|eukprot:EFX75466.1 hypothetical protein DAPPUDRAFT_55959 [Daphnia pulex]
MSSQRGNVSRTRKQKHTNTISFKNNKHGETPKTKALNGLQICNVCSHCKNVLEWKIKYNKYKILSAPAKCTKCLEKTVKQAYSILCQPCAEKLELCAKCGKKEEIVCRPEPTVAEKAQMEAKFQMELKSLSERKRRTFMRYLDRLGKVKHEGWFNFN